MAEATGSSYPQTGPVSGSRSAEATGSYFTQSFVWISPRRTQAVPNALAAGVARTFLLHSLLTPVTLPLDELCSAPLAVAEIPPTTAKGFEHRLLRLAQKIRLGGTHVAFVVTPNSHRQSKAATWVQRWNRLEHVPFQFLRTCTCCLGTAVPGQHHPVFLGTSYPVPTGTCNFVQVTGCERAR